MSQMLTRMFAYFTVVAYLVVGTVVVRVLNTDHQEINFTTNYFTLLSESKIEAIAQLAEVKAPEMKFEFNTQKPKTLAVVKPVKQKLILKAIAKDLKWESVTSIGHKELPFASPIKLIPIHKESNLEGNLIGLYEDFSYQENKVEVAVQKKMVSDEVKVTQSVQKEVEPEFFEYESKKTEEKEKLVAENNEVKIEEDISDLMSQPNLVTTQKSRPNQEIAPEYSKNNTSFTAPADDTPAPIIDMKKIIAKTKTPLLAQNTEVSSQKMLAPKSFMTAVTIHALGMDLKGSEKLQGFELRFQDQSGGTLEDYGGGSVVFEENLAAPKMTRSVVMLKKGFVPTSTEIILEEGTSEVAIPLIEEDVLYQLNESFEQQGAVGSLLVELDDETEVAKLDVPFGKVIKLNGDLKPTENEDFRYELFLGVKAGNAMISYQKGSGEIVNRIVHVHENELTYDANFYEEIVNEKIKLYEEDLLAKETSPLILSTEQVRVFTKETPSKKINQNTYYLNFDAQNLGGRRYVELTHQSEPIFVGIRENNNLTIPSESFMRYILSNFENSKLGQRCMVQVNLTKKILSYEVHPESTGSSLVTYHQVLDRDGKFYESVSEKSRKIVILGESHATGERSQDAKINIRIQYLDGSFQFLNSYCSPNTYLVEQL